MIDKVNGQKYYEYAKINQSKRKNIDSPEFHLESEKQGVIYEKSEDKKKDPKVESRQDAVKASQTNDSSGVTVEISQPGKEKARQKEQRADLKEQVKRFAQMAVTFFKSLWDRIWNEPEGKGQEEFPEVLKERMAGTGENPGVYPQAEAEGMGQYLLPGPEGDTMRPSYTQEEIRAIFRRGNRKEIEDFLSDNGQRHLVKNSDLLTQYDRTGAIVGVDHKELILHGNKNEIKL